MIRSRSYGEYLQELPLCRLVGSPAGPVHDALTDEVMRPSYNDMKPSGTSNRAPDAHDRRCVPVVG
eukprot:CAMPEP_0205881460 /NCGR_PEP_ID=MMETSP1083-20121108/16477_1 /ASSEMBLY_ACC=CAM_ASM_000430 /TAXON_ID=97485 /ORGANISM="Prymnesium parvum, Strain Texoma1" /LENGTH=65 /DNA_ID=CAMNT_0053244557 /DNA_START=254 /DNA_END=451 /DNA_ORIENTATION=-